MKISIRFLFLLFLLANNVYANSPKVVERVSAGGIKFWEIEDHYLPIVSLHIVFTKSGSAYDPEGKLGVANMVSDLLTEGAAGVPGLEFMKRIEALATKINVNVDEDNFYISLTCLKENLGESLRLLALALRSPDFSGESVERVRKSVLTNITRQGESAEAMASKIFKENYFKGHPYSRQIEGDVEGVKAITRKDLRSFVTNHFVRGNMLVGVAGSVATKETAALLDKYFISLPQVQGDIKELADFVPVSSPGRIIRIEHEVPQSVVWFGFAGPKRADKDFYDLYVANHIFGGGGFESRLMDEVREKRGLAYTVYTYVQTYAKAGLVSGYLATKNETVDEALAVVRDEVMKMHNSGVTEKELTDGQDYLVGSFPLRMTKNSNLAAFISSMQYENLGIDFLEKRNGYIRAVNIENVNKAAAKYFDPDNILTVVVGKTK